VVTQHCVSNQVLANGEEVRLQRNALAVLDDNSADQARAFDIRVDALNVVSLS
jgi:hypothetical protein